MLLIGIHTGVDELLASTVGEGRLAVIAGAERSRPGVISDRPTKPLQPRVHDDVCLLGSPETVTVELHCYAAPGATHVQLRVAPGDMPAYLVARTIRLAGEQLLPRFA